MRKAYETECEGCEECVAHEEKEILALDEGRWEKLELTVDSGAMETVAPRKCAANVKMRETAATGKQFYSTANGASIPNYGEKRLQWRTEDKSQGGITVQITDVMKPLASVGQICEAGNRVVFESEGGYVENLNTGVKTSMRKAGKGYKLDLWVKARNKEDELMEITGGTSGENKNEGFKWQGTP